LFLDEITEMPPELQVKLLRVLETDSLARVGGEQPLRIDVRVLAATNCDLDEALRNGRLRGDLYYRLKVFHIDLPPLCERRGDIELLAQAFLEELLAAEGHAKRFSEAAVQKLGSYAWPGNVRQLRNAVHFAYVLSQDVIDVDSLPPEVVAVDRPDDSRHRGSGDEEATSGSWLSVRVGSTIADVEQRLIIATLREYADNKPKVADVLGISLKTLYNRLNRYQSSTAGEKTNHPSEVAAESDEDATEEVGLR
jgi:two-component system response regulator AtoC